MLKGASDAMANLAMPRKIEDGTGSAASNANFTYRRLRKRSSVASWTGNAQDYVPGRWSPRWCRNGF